MSLQDIKRHDRPIASVALSPDSTKIVSCARDNNILIWSIKLLFPIQTLNGHSDTVNSVAWSPDGTKIVSGSFDLTIKIWNAERGRVLKTFKKQVYPVSSVAWSPDGTKIVSGSFDEGIKIWNAESGKLIKTLEGHTRSVDSVAWSSTKIVSGSFDNTIKLWNVETYELIKTLNGHSDTVNSVAISPDDTKIVSGSDDKTIKVWNVDSGSLLKTLGGVSRVFSVAWSPDGTEIVSGSDDTLVIIWNVERGEIIDKLTGHEGRVTSVAWSSTKIVSGSWDRRIYVWDVYLDQVELERKEISNTLYFYKKQLKLLDEQEQQKRKELKLLNEQEQQKRKEWAKLAINLQRLKKMHARVREWDTKIKNLTLEEYQKLIKDSYKTKMSKCKNNFDMINVREWEAEDFRNTAFLRFKMENGNEETWCLSDSRADLKIDPNDKPTSKDNFIFNMLYANWVEGDGSPYKVDQRMGIQGRPGSERYIRITGIFNGSDRYLVFDDLLKTILKLKKGDGSDTDSEIGFEVPRGKSFPVGIYLKFKKRVAIGNTRGTFGISETHGNLEVDVYKVTTIYFFKHYESIDALDKPRVSQSDSRKRRRNNNRVDLKF